MRNLEAEEGSEVEVFRKRGSHVLSLKLESCDTAPSSRLLILNSP
jgi:hypothetical protein